jgi:hypothetical protein
MSSLRNNASYNGRLSNYAAGLAQDLQSSLAEFLFPTVRVPQSSGQFKRFDDKNAFQVYETSRALGNQPNRIKLESTDPFYNCKPQGLQVTVDDAEKEAAGADAQLLEENKIKTLLGATTLSHEDKVLGILKAGVTAVGARGVWSNASNDPVAELDEQIEAIATATGMMPNRIAFGIGAWRVFRNHPLVRARQPGAELIGLTPAQAVAMTLNPQMELKVGILSRDTTKFGAAKAATNIVGAEVFLFYNSANPTQYDPSFAKNFTTLRGSVDAVMTHREEPVLDVHTVMWSEDPQVVSTACVRRLTIT